MWYSQSLAKNIDTEFADSSFEFLKNTARILVFTILAGTLAVYFVSVATWIDLLTWQFSILAACIILISTLTLWLLPRRTVLSLVLWQLGLAASITFAVLIFPNLPLEVLYIALPFLSAVTLGWQAGAVMGLLVLGLITVLNQYAWLPGPASAQNILTILLATFLGLLGWMATYSLLTTTRWSAYYYRQARTSLEDARNQRAELIQTKEDLIKANQELARLTDRLKALQQEADEARQAKAAFVANVSHELRAPLNMIIGFSEMITRSPRSYGARLPAPLLADIAIIQRNATHLARLVDDVLDLSQVETGRMALSKEKTPIYEIVKSAVTSVKPLFESKGLYLEVDLPPNLPLLYCDRTRIHQVIINLLSNAGRFTMTGGVGVKVEHVENELIFRVTDTGPGIAPDDQTRLFVPFQQVDSSLRRQHGGSGLGLSICKSFIEMHGGKIWMDSEIGIGTTISFTLSLDKQAHELGLPISAPASRWVNEYLLRDKRIRPFMAPPPRVIPQVLLVESGSSLQRLFNRYAERVDALSVSCITEALEVLSHSPAQALIVNTHKIVSPSDLPELMQELSCLPYDTPAIVCWLPDRDDAARELGVVDYLVKPVMGDTLLEAVSRLDKDIRTILVVDDDIDLLQLFGRILTNAKPKYRTWWASDGEEALQILRQRKPDLMILDLIMPHHDGFEVLREKQVDESIKRIPVIVITALDPVNEAIVTNTLLVNRKNGLSTRELIDFIQAVSQVLTPAVESSAPA
jgi:signal transduction histidine kinase/CheY-like chemotaxis protein